MATCEISRNQILIGDVRERLRDLPDESVHCVVTSPPYWGLRDYGAEGQIGLEPTPEAYVANLVDVFREVRRVLRDDGTLWLNLGDCYATGAGSYRNPGSDVKPIENGGKQAYTRDYARAQPNRMPQEGLKPKDLVGIPWRVAFALQADGWYLRSDIIWSKPNPMPESVTDRPTKAHEYIFLLTKSERYFYDIEAIKEPLAQSLEHFAERHKYGAEQTERLNAQAGASRVLTDVDAMERMVTGGRNRRTVWEIPTEPFPQAHFATYPQALVLPCIQAGTSEYGCCAECGAPWRRVVERKSRADDQRGSEPSMMRANLAGPQQAGVYVETRITGWESTCYCGVPDGMDRGKANLAIERERGNWTPAPLARAVVLDPFMGSGTTGLVAYNAGRDFVGIELNPTYAAMARKRIGVERGRLL